MMRLVLSAAGALLLCVVIPNSAPATPVTPDQTDPKQAAIQQVLDQAFSEMMRPGPTDPNWNKGGVDLEGMLRSSPGGTSRNYLLTVDKDGDRTVEIYTSNPVNDFLPANWLLVSHTGAIDKTAADAILGIGSLDKRYYYVVRARGPRIGNALCSEQLFGAQLYEDPRGSTDMPAEFAIAIFNYMARRMEEFTVCTKYEGNGPAYSYRHFLKDGRALPALAEEGSVTSIVPAAPVVELLKVE